MNFQKLHQNQKIRAVLGIVFIFCILISSCAVKFGIKNFLNLQTHSKVHSSTPKDKLISVSSGSQCNFCKEKEIIVKGDTQFNFSDLQELALFTFVVLAGTFLLLKILKHPVYDSSKIANALPIFLQYRKLII